MTEKEEANIMNRGFKKLHKQFMKEKKNPYIHRLYMNGILYRELEPMNTCGTIISEPIFLDEIKELIFKPQKFKYCKAYTYVHWELEDIVTEKRSRSKPKTT